MTSLQEWLQQHAQQIARLRVRAAYSGSLGALTLPAVGQRQLEALDADHVRLTWRNDNGSGGGGVQPQPAVDVEPATVLLPALQQLSLASCQVRASDIAALQAPQLTALSLKEMACVPRSSSQQLSSAVVGLLQRLPQLSTLMISSMNLGEVEHLSAMQHLQSCTLEYVDASSLVPVVCAPSLTELRLEGCGQVLSCTTVPAGAWQGLKSLRLEGTSLQPAVLACLPQLERLHLDTLRLLPAFDVSNLAVAGG